VKLSPTQFLAGFAVIPGVGLIATAVFEAWHGLAIILDGGPTMAADFHAYATGGEMAIGIVCGLLGVGVWAAAFHRD
jgi:hypothetical protein